FFFSVSLFPAFFQDIAQRSLLPFCFQHIPYRAALHSEFSAFFTIVPFPVVLLGHLMFSPSF
ncbi:hypothetical protein, partial [Pedobacter sp. ok626]|uniref:hypothetical protein n=1 Tax=Pedobacter sp. ok626 TaxID=1761882 RepID=UPI001C31A5CC